jgi:hypothetical protein
VSPRASWSSGFASTRKPARRSRSHSATGWACRCRGVRILSEIILQLPEIRHQLQAAGAPRTASHGI